MLFFHSKKLQKDIGKIQPTDGKKETNTELFMPLNTTNGHYQLHHTQTDLLTRICRKNFSRGNAPKNCVCIFTNKKGGYD